MSPVQHGVLVRATSSPDTEMLSGNGVIREVGQNSVPRRKRAGISRYAHSNLLR